MSASTSPNYGLERFQADTANHQMTVLHDDGLYRHLRFKAPNTGSYWFDLITWPGTLAIRGDIDGYMFTRVTDMFEFFRMHRTPKDGRLEINPHYWSEKVEGRRDVTRVYSQDLFREHVLDYLKNAVQDRSAPTGLGKAIREEILNDPDISHEDVARKLVESFAYGTVYLGKCFYCKDRSPELKKRESAKGWERIHQADHPGHTTYVHEEPAFQFCDIWEWDLKDYDPWFLWACHAIVWGIAQYDASKQAALTTAGEPR